MSPFRFPKNFFWGASLSSHQTEGGNINNWSEWEIRNAYELANDAQTKRGWLPNWNEIKKEALDPQNYISGKAADHYNKYTEDFDIAKQLNFNALRFSIEWSRIEPKEGEFDEVEIKHYHEYLDALVSRNLEPFMTIWHWTVPLWFEEKGGFKKQRNIKYFERFVQKIAQEYGSKVKYWITLNEPRIYSSEAFINKRWPPQNGNIFTYFIFLMNLQKAHRRAYKIIKKFSKHSEIGIAENIASYVIFDRKLLNRITRRLFSWYELMLLRRVASHLDFIGLNYYFHRHIQEFSVSKMRLGERSSDLGWDLHPSGIRSPLTRLKEFKKPIIITENGLADAKDIHREWYIPEVLWALDRAMREGVDLRGYLHWSLIDNFEWDSGFWPRFGLVEVDYKNNFRRKIRKSAFKFGEIIKDIDNSSS